MKKMIPLIALYLFSFAFAKAQSTSTSSYQSLMMQYFKASGIDAEYELAYDGMMKMFKDAYQTEEVPSTVWKKIEASKTTSVAKFKGILASEYRSIFDDKQDLENLIEFYTSETGIQLKKNPNGLSEEQKMTYDNFVKSNTGTKLYGRLGRINKAKESASMYWSRELFCDVTSQLKELGFKSSMPMGNCG